MKRCLLWLALGCAGAVSGCAREINEGENAGPNDGGMDGGTAEDSGGSGFGNPDGSSGGHAGAGPSDASLAPDAFFINDPQPPVCGPDGEPREAPMPGGTASCPDDKIREGCPCPASGMTAACWPGKRVNREHGICKDGTTTCNDTEEFGLRWGPCAGYVLPAADAVAGPQACRCFSAGRWAIANLVPCISQGAAGTFLYSSYPTAEDPVGCNNPSNPPALPAGNWSKSTLTVDCTGQFKLCYAIKAGDVNAPQPDDCVVMKVCVDIWYEQAGVEQSLQDLPAWTSTDAACSAKFTEQAGYGEMTVIGHSSECDAVDDGMGDPYVFFRTDYCKPGEMCETGGSGMFE